MNRHLTYCSLRQPRDPAASSGQWHVDSSATSQIRHLHLVSLPSGHNGLSGHNGFLLLPHLIKFNIQLPSWIPASDVTPGSLGHSMGSPLSCDSLFLCDVIILGTRVWKRHVSLSHIKQNPLMTPTPPLFLMKLFSVSWPCDKLAIGCHIKSIRPYTTVRFSAKELIDI